MKFFKKRLLSISIGIVYLWFGILKFFPGISPAEELAKSTIDLLFVHIISKDLGILLLAIWETGIGIALIIGLRKKIIVPIALLHIILTFSPLILFPQLIFEKHIVGLSLLGQYILKNIIIISALINLYPGYQYSEKHVTDSSFSIQRIRGIIYRTFF